MTTGMSKWGCQLGGEQGQEQSLVCRATAAGTFGNLDGFLVPLVSPWAQPTRAKDAPPSPSPSITMPEGKGSPNSAFLVVTQTLLDLVR